MLKNNLQVIVIDNNSQDETGAALQKLHIPNLELIEAKENLGFGRANNKALEKAHGQYILFLNSDTVVLDTALEKMVLAFEKHPVDDQTADLVGQVEHLDRLGILAAYLLHPDKSAQPQGGAFPTLFSLAGTLFFLDDVPIIGRFLPSVQHTGRSQQVSKASGQHLFTQDWVGGTAMMVRKSMLEEIGSFDPNIFMYGEDIELCLRAKNHHWDVAIDPQAKVVHYGSASSSSSKAIIGEFQAYIYIWAKHKPAWQMPILKLILRFSAHLKKLVFGTILQQPQKAEPYTQLLQNVLR